jgi:hypothetical protein
VIDIKKQKIHQIIPRLPPAIDGVGDYALSLARQLRHDYDIDTHFIIGVSGISWFARVARTV